MKMNPLYQALKGVSPASASQTGSSSPANAGGPFGALQSVLQRANEIASGIQNPEQLVRKYFPDAPADLSGNPEQLIGWLERTGRVNPQMVQTARQLMGR